MTNISRRKLMTAGSVLAATAALPGAAVASSKSVAEPKVHHMVYFWMKNPASARDREKLIAGLKSLEAIEQVQKLFVGVPASTLKRDVVDNSFHVSELMMFNSTEDQDAYQIHPLHMKFIEEHSDLWDRVVVHDSIVG